MAEKPSIHLIAGPTASGKSARALQLAQALNGVIINADATQCYYELSVLSARPNADELAMAEHQLYGIWRGDRPGNVSDWLHAAMDAVNQAWERQKPPILCGGTGMYLKAFKEGLSPIPEIAVHYRQEAAEALAKIGHNGLHQKLVEIDPAVAKKIPPQNTQRLLRAWEVWLATGKPLGQWQAIAPTPPFPDATIHQEVITIDRETLYQRCNARFDHMLAHGALEEVRQIAKLCYPADSPVMKAVGVPELMEYLNGETSLEEASEKAKRNTRRYAKRQLTWLRHQL